MLGPATLRLLGMVILLSGILNSSLVFSADNPDIENQARLRARGQAFMEQDDFGNAINIYQQAAQAPLAAASDQINLGIAYYHNGNNDQSIETLKAALEKDPKNPFALYILGLAYKKAGDNEQAAQYFRQVVEIDPTDIPAVYNLGLALAKSGKTEEAISWLEKVTQMDPNHTASYYNLSFAIRPKDPKRAQELLKKFAELKKKDTTQKPTDFVDEGKYFIQISFDIPCDQQPKLTSDLKPEFKENTTWENMIREALGSESGRVLAVIPDIQQRTNGLVISNASQTVLLTLDAQGKLVSNQKLMDATAEGAYPADYDNDVDMDFLLYSNNQTWLLQNDGTGNYKDLTKAIGITAQGANDVFWADFDHEGDLDLFMARPEAGDAIYQNNGDGTFKDVTGNVLGLDLGKSYSIVLSDLDNDNDLDVAHSTPDRSIEIFLNLREIRFKKIYEKERITIQAGDPEQFKKIVYPGKLLVRNLENDDRMDIVEINRLNGQRPHSVLSNPSSHLMKDGELATTLIISSDYQIDSIFDANNDGFEDFICQNYLGQHPSTQVILNKHPQPFEPNFGFALPSIVYYTLTADLDFDGDLDILGVNANRQLVSFENTTPNQNHSIALDILGKKNAADGFGCKIEIKDGLFYEKKEVSSILTHLGIGNREKVDVVRLTWPNGIFQNIISATPQILGVSERPGYAGSCPFVYTWNGEKFEFIADALSTGPLGLYVGGGYFPMDPDEYVRVRSEQLKAKDGKFEIRFKEELREITYLDQLELLSVTHPQNVPIFTHECFTTPPHPEFKLIGLSPQAKPPKRVIDNQGQDVTGLIAERDCRYPRPFTMGHYEGVGEEYFFEIDLNDMPKSDNLTLFMTGYVDWPNSSVARSLEQNPALDFVMPYVQVKNAKGEWETVLNPMGFPAGKLKTVPLNVSKLFLTGDQTLRIVSTLQVHWDQIRVDPAPIHDGFQIERHPLVSADFYYGGYSRSYDLNGVGPHWYDYDQRENNTRWDYIRGFFTRYGDVLPLLQEFDDQYVIMGPGDEVAAQFTDSRKEENPHTTYFVHLTGWVKDADYSTAFSTDVEPLPFKGMKSYPFSPDEEYPMDEAHADYVMQYNTRLIQKQTEPLTIPQKLGQAE